MATQPQSPARVAFGPFEANVSTGELFKHGVRIRLPGQPFQILLRLLDHPGTVVTREQLRDQIWGGETFVDFEHSLNVAMNKLRRALGDSAENPRYIETVPGRGYRFIGAIQWLSGADAEPEVTPLPTLVEPAIASKGTRWSTVAVAVGLVAIVAGVWGLLHPRNAMPDVRVQQLTTNAAENPIWHAVISPDGKYLAYGDLAGIQVRLIATGETHLLPRPQLLRAGDAWFPAAWSPDGTRIFVTSITAKAVTAWKLSAIGGAATAVRDNAAVQSISPDGSLVAFVTSTHMGSTENEINRRLVWNSEIWTMGPDGENARKVVLGDDLTYFGSVRWSPDGKRIAYQKYRIGSGESVDYTIETCDRTGGAPAVVFSTQHYSGPSLDHIFPEDFCWLRDGRIVYAVREDPPNSRDSNLWEIFVDPQSGAPRTRPRRITKLAGFHMGGLSAAADTKRLLFESSVDQSHVYVGQLAADGSLSSPRRITADERYNTPYGWTSDSKAVIFRSDRTGTFRLYKQALDQDVPEMIPTGAGSTSFGRPSPDGNWVIYPVLFNAVGESRLMRVPLAGGPPQVIFERTKVLNFSCSHRSLCVMAEAGADGKDYVFSSFDPSAAVRRVLFTMPREPENWNISPDGSHIAIVGDDREGRIEIRSLSGQIESRVEAQGWPHPFSVDWSVDGRSLYVSHPGLIDDPSGPIGTTVLHVNLGGRVKPLWETRGGRYAWAIPSPDGKSLAIRGATTGRNAWLIDNF